MNEGEYGEGWKDRGAQEEGRPRRRRMVVACMGGAEASAHVLTRSSRVPA
jgi:hypothetical protein